MASIWPLFKQKLATVNIDFNLLPGLLEAKYGGISTLKLVVPHAPTVQKWVVIEMGKGSTQITRFAKKDYVELSNELWNKEQEEAMLKFNQEFEQQDFKQQRRSSIKKETNDQWTTHFNPDTNQTFYHNELTGASQYNDPNVAPQEEPQAYIQAEFAKKRRSSMSTNIGNTEWAVHTDPKTKDIFYHNSKTGLSCWTIPEDASEKTTDQMQKAFDQAQFTQKRRTSIVAIMDNSEWEEHTDPNTNQVFYHNQKTGVSSWEMPTEKDAGNNSGSPETKEGDNTETVQVGEVSYLITEEPEMIPIGFKNMINDASNHRSIVATNKDDEATRIVVIGSGFHVAVALCPTIAGLTPDITSDYNANDPEGKLTFASINECCRSIEVATSVKIRKNPLDEEEKKAEGNQKVLSQIQIKRDEQLVEYKSNLITWLQSLGADHDQTCVTFVRNMYPMDPATSSYLTTSAKPVWVTGLGVDFALDCGSG